MPDQPIWDLLKRDHEAVAVLLDDTRSAEEARAREILCSVDTELTAHTRAEEAVFHGHLLHDERARAAVVDGLEEHKRIHAALAELERLPVGDEKWSVRLAQLGEAVRSHFKAEEDGLFVLARQCLSGVQASEIGARYVSERERIKADLTCFVPPR